jgi:NitT/TauT family transport system ATP-binding protein
MSKRPGTVLEKIDVVLPRPRSTRTISDQRFSELADRIRRHVYEPDAA